MYEFVIKDFYNYSKYFKKYFILFKEDVYVLKIKEKDKIDKVNVDLGRVILVVFGIEKMMLSVKGKSFNFNGR